MTVKLILLAMALTTCVSMGGEPGLVSGSSSNHLELIAFAGDRTIRIQLQVEIDGKSVGLLQDEAFATLFTFLDRNGDGVLNREEASRLPTPFSLRQNIWGQFGPNGGKSPSWSELDKDKDDKLVFGEVVDFYRRSGLGGTVVGVGRAPNTQALSTALLKALDADGDNTITTKEWQRAPELLSKFDRNEDEMIGADELVSKINYPGASGALMFSAPSKVDRPAKIVDDLPLIVLPLHTDDVYWTKVVVLRRDANKDGYLDRLESGLNETIFAKLNKNSHLGSDELLRWRTLEPDVRCQIELGKQPGDRSPFKIVGSMPGATIQNGRFKLSVGNLQWEIRHDIGKLPTTLADTRKRLTDRFTQVDKNADGVLDEKEASAPSRNGDLALVHAFADRNADGQLTRKEFEVWLDLQDSFANSLAVFTILDHGTGLFELLDSNRDGYLSIRELRGALDRMSSAGLLKDGRYDPATPLPRQLITTVSRGHPLRPLDTGRQAGLPWFRAMDRNGDGDISLREFIGTLDDFKKLDADGDGLISAAEAETYRASTK